jgi:hypothetical protein
MLQVIFFSMQNQQARLAPLRRGMLRDEFGRQFKMKIGRTHGRSFVIDISRIKP